MSFYLLLLQNEADTAIVTQDSCMSCCRDKLGTDILRSFRISKHDFKELKNNSVKAYNVKCRDDCEEFVLLKEF